MEESSASPAGPWPRGWRAACLVFGGVAFIWTGVMLQPAPDAIQPMLSVLRVLAVCFGTLCLVLGLVGLTAGRRAAAD